MASLMLYVYTVASIGLVWVASKLWEHLVVVRRIKKALAQLPSAKMHWFFGHSYFSSLKGEENLKSVRECMAQRPRIEAFWLGNWMVGAVRVWHPDTVKAILKTSEPKFVKYSFMKIGRDFFGDSLVLSSGKKWKRNRTLLNAAYHSAVLKEYIRVKNERAAVFSEKLLKEAGEVKSINMNHQFTLISMEILLRCSFSIESDLQSLQIEDSYMSIQKELQDLWNTRVSQPWVHSSWIYSLTSNGRKWAKSLKLFHQISDNVIAEKRSQSVPTKARDFLDILLDTKDEDGNGLSDSEIRDEVDLFMLAGHETVSQSLSWLTYTLAAHPDAQSKCQNEVDKIIDGKDNDDITMEDLGNMSYLKMCINESMRLHTTVPIIVRELSKPLTVDGVELPVNTVVFVHLYGLHHNPQVWSEPMTFRPERFVSENIEKMDSFSFLPFSGGPRNCIGKNFAMNEMRIIMAKLLRKITFKLDVDKLPIHQPSITMNSENGIYLKIEKRNK